MDRNVHQHLKGCGQRPNAFLSHLTSPLLPCFQSFSILKSWTYRQSSWPQPLLGPWTLPDGDANEAWELHSGLFPVNLSLLDPSSKAGFPTAAGTHPTSLDSRALRLGHFSGWGSGWEGVRAGTVLAGQERSFDPHVVRNPAPNASPMEATRQPSHRIALDQVAVPSGASVSPSCKWEFSTDDHFF